MTEELTIELLMGRVSLSVSLEEAGQFIADKLELGSLTSVEPLLVGYEEVNCKLTAESGDYLLKLFSKHKSEAEVSSNIEAIDFYSNCLLYTSPSPRDRQKSRMPSSA